MSDTTRQEKLDEFEKAYNDADTNFGADMLAAETQIQRHTIDVNWHNHNRNWAMCASAALEKNSPKISELLTDAKAIASSIRDERAKAQAIAKVIRDSADLATKLEGLLKEIAKI